MDDYLITGPQGEHKKLLSQIDSTLAELDKVAKDANRAKLFARIYLGCTLSTLAASSFAAGALFGSVPALVVIPVLILLGLVFAV